MPEETTPDDIGSLASSVSSSPDDLAKVITAGSEAAGVGFAAASTLKFKSHKDNPTQIPLGSAADAASAAKTAASDAGVTSSEVDSAASAVEDKLSE